MALSAQAIREFLGRRFAPQLAALDLDPAALPDDLDLLEKGVIDSMGFIELVADLDEEFGIAVDFEAMDPEQLTVVGPLCRFVAEASEAS